MIYFRVNDTYEVTKREIEKDIYLDTERETKN